MSTDQWHALDQLFSALGVLLAPLWHLLAGSLLLIVWIVWWLWGVNWNRLWPVLATGAWVPVVVLMIAGALAWSQLAPADFTVLGFATVPNFWWQLSSVGLLVAVTLLCGWLQGVFHWTPAEISLEPPAPSGDEHAHH